MSLGLRLDQNDGSIADETETTTNKSYVCFESFILYFICISNNYKMKKYIHS